jgi:branched-chain amino acid transport system substrate-binding protein
MKSAAAALAYDAALVLADAVRRAGSGDRKNIRDALAATSGFSGATGTITLDESGDPINKEAVILKFENGSTVFWKTIKPGGNGQ